MKRHQQKEELKAISEALFQELKADEHMTLTYSGEESLFIRINQSKIRQASDINQGYLSMSFISGNRRTDHLFSITGEFAEDSKRSLKVLKDCREECTRLPEDPYIVFPETGENSDEDYYGELPEAQNLPETLLNPAISLDLAGLFASGTLMRSYMNSKGQFHWFSTENFCFDYSLYTASQKAIKSAYASKNWLEAEYLSNLNHAKSQLKVLEKEPKKLAPGKYRVYFAPAAAAEFVLTLSGWLGLSGNALMQGNSPLKKLLEKKAILSPLFSLDEDFQHGLVPRFNEFGDFAPLKISLINQGKLNSPLVNRRTGQEYNLHSNAANLSETLRSPFINPGSLQPEKILQSLGTGLYISNLHYLNWSDLQNGRITGMTRYGCFWVENGEIVSPIHDLRFDETLYHFWGASLEALGTTAEFIPNTSSYGERTLGGIYTPGMLVNDFTFTF